MIKTAKNFLFDLVFPPLCLACENYLNRKLKDDCVCSKCISSFLLHNHLFCPVCLNRLPEGKNFCHSQAGYVLAAAADYNNPVVQKIIRQFKYKRWQNLTPVLVNLLVDYWKLSSANIPELSNFDRNNWLVIPMPLFKWRQTERGFNQAELLAEGLNRKLNLVWTENNLTRIRNTVSQTEMPDWKAREENVKNAFFINNPEQVRKKNIILVDDIFTSGATTAEAVRVLKSSGAKKIIALVVAKAR